MLFMPRRPCGSRLRTSSGALTVQLPGHLHSLLVSIQVSPSTPLSPRVPVTGSTSENLHLALQEQEVHGVPMFVSPDVRRESRQGG